MASPPNWLDGARRRLALLRYQVADLQRRGTPVYGAGHKIIGNVGQDGVFHLIGSGQDHHRPGTTTFYHVAHESYARGDPLVGLAHARDVWGIPIPFKWEMPEDLYGIDAHGVSLHRTLTDAREHAQDWEPKGHILRIHIPNDFIAHDPDAEGAAREAWPFAGHIPEYPPRFDKNGEGFPFVQGFIPPDWIEETHPEDTT